MAPRRPARPRASALVRALAMALALAMPAGALLTTTPAGAAQPASWKSTGFATDASELRLRAVLEQFALVYGVRLSMNIKGERVLKGRIKGDSGEEFLNRLSQAAPFRWFVYNDTLHVVAADDNVSMRLEVGEDAVQDAKGVMVGVGLFDARFGWGELPDTGTVVVSGPRAYVNLAREILMPEHKKVESKERQVMMFRLKYASVSDRVINVRGQSETIPGMKTILSNLLYGAPSGEKLADVPAIDTDLSRRSRRLKSGGGAVREVDGGANGGVAALVNTKGGFMPMLPPPGGGRTGGMPTEEPSTFRADSRADSRAESRGSSQSGSRSGGHEKSRPRIEANPALNAILIYDTADTRPMYAELIAQLDVQPQQIEIEALIVDIDRSRLTELGVEWGVRAGAVNVDVNPGAGESLGAALPLGGATLLISNAARFYARLKAMEANGEARVLATPTVLTIDNVAAVLDLSQTAYVSLVGERIADLADITAGTMLRVIPRIIREGAATRVHMEVDIEDGALDNPGGNAKGGAGNVNVTRSTISTQAIIDTQQTLMIGGYRAERMATDRQKVPLLGDLPLVGGLFRTENKSRSTRERLFLLTPRLLGTSAITAPAISATRARSRDVAPEGYAPAAQAQHPPALQAAPLPRAAPLLVPPVAPPGMPPFGQSPGQARTLRSANAEEASRKRLLPPLSGAAGAGGERAPALPAGPPPPLPRLPLPPTAQLAAPTTVTTPTPAPATRSSWALIPAAASGR